MQPPVIILGMHRSGTSLLTGCLEAAGLYLGEANDAATFNKKGNKENQQVRLLHDDVLRRHGLNWKLAGAGPLSWTWREKRRLKKLLAPYRKINQAWGVKDPRIVWVLDEWLKIFPEARLIGVFRHPMLVACSLAARGPNLALSVEEGLRLWYDTNQRIFTLQSRLGFPLLHFSEPTEMETYFFGPLREFSKNIGLLSEPSTFFDNSLVNQTQESEALPFEIAKLYEQLIKSRATTSAR